MCYCHFLLLSVCVCLMYWGAPMLGAQIFTIVISSSWTDSLDHYIMSFLISCNLLYFKVYFVWYEDCYSSILLLPICMEYIFCPLTFSLYVSWGLKWVSCRQHIYGFCFCIHSASLCLLVGAFNPFTFKVVVDMCSYCHFLNCLGLIL